MASGDAKPYPIKNVAYRFTFAIRDADGDPVVGAGGFDSEISKDGGAFADGTNEATEIGRGVYYLDLTASEMNADTVAVCVQTTTSGAKNPVFILYPAALGDWTQLADELLLRTTAQVEASGSPARSLYGVMAALTHKRERDGTDSNIILYKSDDATILATIPITKNGGLMPVRVIDPP